jgi:hypothetical protein
MNWNWLNQVFAQQSITWLLFSSVVAFASSFLSSWLTYRFIKRQEIIDETKWQGEIRKKVEAYLGDRSAEREYNLEARKRLYHAIGPLRFQLVIACRDAATRINNYGLNQRQRYSMTMENYYGRNTLYRLLRPMAIAELIEQQITYADFSVDLSSVELLHFKRAAYIAFTDGDFMLGHPMINWDFQNEHLFSGTLSRLANLIIIQDDEASNKKRTMHFHEFDAFIHSPEKIKLFSPLTKILDDFSIKDKPVFWLRLICYGYICNQHVEEVGESIGFKNLSFDLNKLLLESQDDYTLLNRDKYQKTIQSLLNTKL